MLSLPAAHQNLCNPSNLIITQLPSLHVQNALAALTNDSRLTSFDNDPHLTTVSPHVSNHHHHRHSHPQVFDTHKSSPHIPYDIVSLIIQNFLPARGVSKTRAELVQFATLGLVSWEWYNLIYPRLYADIIFNDTLSRIDQRNLCAVLQSTPRLASIVRSCTVSVSPSDHYGGAATSDAPHITDAISRMTSIQSLQLHQVDIANSLLAALTTRHTLKNLTLVGCLFSIEVEQQENVKIAFQLNHLKIHGSPPMGHDIVIGKLFESNSLESLSIDSLVTSIGLRALQQQQLDRLQYLYAEPSRDDSELFCATLKRCSVITRLGFSHGPKSIPLDDVPFAALSSSENLSHLTHWTGPSSLVNFFFPNGRNAMQHIALDQVISVDGKESPYAEQLRPRNLSTSPEIESARIEAMRSLLSQPSSIRTLDAVLSSSHSIKEVVADCRVELDHLRVKCTETDGHTSGLKDASGALSKLVTLNEIRITSPPGFGEPEIERDLIMQRDMVDHWSRVGQVERIAFSAWLRWHRASKGEWTPLVTQRDVAMNKTGRWRRRRMKVTDWDGHLGDAVGTKVDFIPTASLGRVALAGPEASIRSSPAPSSITS